MNLTSFLLLFFLAHVVLFAVLAYQTVGLPDWMVPAISMLATVLFAIVAISSENLSVVDDGQSVSHSEPVIGIYAFGLAVLAFLLTAYTVLKWFEQQGYNSGGSSV